MIYIRTLKITRSYLEGIKRDMIWGRLDGQYLLFREAYRVAIPGHTLRMRWEHLAWSVNVVICMTLGSKCMQMSCSDQRSRCFVLSLMLLVRTRSSSNLCFDFSINLSKARQTMSYFRIFPYSNLAQPRRMLCLHGSVICFSFLYTDIGNLGLKVELSLAKFKFWTSWPQGSQCCCRKPTCWRTFRLWCASPFQIPVSWNCAIGGKTLEWSFVTIFCHLIDSCLPCSPCHVIQFYSYFWSIMMMLVKMMLRSLAFLCSLIVAGISMSSLNNNSSSSNGLTAEQWNSLAA